MPAILFVILRDNIYASPDGVIDLLNNGTGYWNYYYQASHLSCDEQCAAINLTCEDQLYARSWTSTCSFDQETSGSYTMASACQLTQMIVVVQGDTFTVRGDATNANDLYVLVASTGTPTHGSPNEECKVGEDEEGDECGDSRSSENHHRFSSKKCTTLDGNFICQSCPTTLNNSPNIVIISVKHL